MSVPINSVVDVQITKERVIPSRFEFSNVNFVGTSDVISLSERIRTYANIDQVQNDFDTTSEEYKASTIFFSRNPRPTSLKISRWANVDTKAELRSGLSVTTDIATWIAVTDGSFRITIDGVAQNIDGLDFSLTTNLAGVASVVEAGIIAGGFVGATCVYSTSENRFIIKSGTTGATSTISYLETSTGTVGTDISGTLAEKYLDSITGSSAELNQGVIAESVQDALGIIEQKDNTWYIVCFEKSVRDNADARSVSEWCESRIKFFLNVSNDPNTGSPVSTSDIMYDTNLLKRDRTVIPYNIKDSEYSDVSAASYGAITTPGTSTWNFKEPTSGITPSTELTTTQFNTILSKKGNVYITRAGRNQFAEGTVASGEYIDVIIGIDALQYDIENRVFNSLSKLPKIPQTQAGINILENDLAIELQKYENIGFLASQDVYDEEGEYVETLPAFSISSEPLATQNPADKANRIAPTINFTAYLAGAIHKVVIRGVVTI